MPFRRLTDVISRYHLCWISLNLVLAHFFRAFLLPFSFRFRFILISSQFDDWTKSISFDMEYTDKGWHTLTSFTVFLFIFVYYYYYYHFHSHFDWRIILSTAKTFINSSIGWKYLDGNYIDFGQMESNKRWHTIFFIRWYLNIANFVRYFSLKQVVIIHMKECFIEKLSHVTITSNGHDLKSTDWC